MTKKNTRNTERKVANLLTELGMPHNLIGYSYVKKAILISMENREYLYKITRLIYPRIAKDFCTNSSSVERGIRHAIEVAWDRGDLETLQKYFGYTVSNTKGKPTNSEFIAMLVDYMNDTLDEVSDTSSDELTFDSENHVRNFFLDKLLAREFPEYKEFLAQAKNS